MRQKDIEFNYEEHRQAGFSGNLRDYFAGCALTGLLVRNDALASPPEQLAAEAWTLADEMLAARDPAQSEADRLDDLLK